MWPGQHNVWFLLSWSDVSLNSFSIIECLVTLDKLEKKDQTGEKYYVQVSFWENLYLYFVESNQKTN